ncbi:hypothetical protein B296_00008898 [Ensete ventricosum]|uniref:Uncharacterized protein n=1 Tax=Ensete ventricosum TaxID=4639 RepID=A0A426YFJ6_ENSVE|nr:hypothetical protein B296_00008898 [Ensete ventricosum]
MASPYGAPSVLGESGNEPSQDRSDDSNKTKQPPHKLDLRYFGKVKSLIRHGKTEELLNLATTYPDRKVNLMEDSLLHIVIACGKTDLAKSLIGQKQADIMATNWYGDTPLHVAATVGDCEVATELVRKNKNIIRKRNSKLETPLHKAALYGHRDMFWCLSNEDNDCFKDRREDGATVLHCAIMGNAPCKFNTNNPRQYIRRDSIVLASHQNLASCSACIGNRKTISRADHVTEC